MGFIKSGIEVCLATLVFLGAVAGAAWAQSDRPAERTDAGIAAAAPRCVILNTILDGEVLSGLEVLLALRDGTELLATLARDCPQLKFHDSFTYQTVGGRLCAGEGRIVARSGEACLISSFSAAGENTGGEDALPINP